jgi:hypothetical protein
MNEKSAIALKIDGTIDWLIKHRFHGKIAAIKHCTPDLLTTKRQHIDMTTAIGDAQRLCAGSVSESRKMELAHRTQ